MRRRELFSSLASFNKKQESKPIIRPPYYNHEELFIHNCIDCDGRCEKACDENIIKIDNNKTPYLDFGQSGCTYCDDCALACEMGVLKVENKRDINTKITINVLKCLSWQKTICFSCKDICLDEAINYLGVFRAEIDYKKCTNCGFCVGVCPTNAIKVEKWQ